MRNITLHRSSTHKFILLNESEPGDEGGIRSNQYLIMEGGAAVLLDPEDSG
ncbi:flavoprotein [mine drainage metagenome]|uniref:Flavoprotein n=1 Tax=mine drainage metagenome TaxID=410659 RepID=T1BY95_9ZZZZ